jgi:geranylgeranyl pyrophosphate synthase
VSDSIIDTVSRESRHGLERRIEAAIGGHRGGAGAGAAPPRLASALNYAVTPGGARIRPTILLSVALACGDDRPASPMRRRRRWS